MFKKVWKILFQSKFLRKLTKRGQGYVKSLAISSGITFALYFLALLFKGLGYISLDFFELGDARGELIGKSLVEPILFLVLMLCFWIAVAKDQRVFYVLLVGFPVLLIMQMVIAFGSLDGSPVEIDNGRTYCKALFTEIDVGNGIIINFAEGQEDKEALCKTSLIQKFQ